MEFILYEEAAAEGRWNLPLGVEETGVGRGSKEVKALRDVGVERGCEYGGGWFPKQRTCIYRQSFHT